MFWINKEWALTDRRSYGARECIDWCQCCPGARIVWQVFRVTPDVALAISQYGTMARHRTGIKGGLAINKIIELFEKDQVKHQEKAVIAILGETLPLPDNRILLSSKNTTNKLYYVCRSCTKFFTVNNILCFASWFHLDSLLCSLLYILSPWNLMYIFSKVIDIVFFMALTPLLNCRKAIVILKYLLRISI